MPSAKPRRPAKAGGRPPRKPVTPAVTTADLPVLRRFRRNFRWDQVALEPYKSGPLCGADFAGASRQVMVGKDGAPVAFELRYFELQPGGFTSLQRHRHCHVIIGVRGRGRIRVGEQEHRLAPLDIAYVGPYQPHRLTAQGRTPFGFFCIVDRRRDKPRPVKD